MRELLVEEPVGRRIARLAAAQDGVVARRQLLALGMSPSAIGRRVAAGALYAVARGAYAVGHPRVSRAGTLTAAVLACGEAAALSHWSAAERWEIAQRMGSLIHVTVRRPGGRCRRGVVLHRCPALPDAQVTIRRGAPITTVERTVLDIAASASDRQVERLLDEAHRLRLFHRQKLEQILTEGGPGTRTLRRVLSSHEAGATWTRNEFEEAFLTLVDGASLPRPRMNHPVGPYVLDCLWPDARLAVELDGRGSHLTPRAFEGDRDRDSYLYAEYGIVTLRFTFNQVTRTPAVVVHRVRRALRAGPISRRSSRPLDE